MSYWPLSRRRMCDQDMPIASTVANTSKPTQIQNSPVATCSWNRPSAHNTHNRTSRITTTSSMPNMPIERSVARRKMMKPTSRIRPIST